MYSWKPIQNKSGMQRSSSTFSLNLHKTREDIRKSLLSWYFSPINNQDIYIPSGQFVVTDRGYRPFDFINCNSSKLSPDWKYETKCWNGLSQPGSHRLAMISSLIYQRQPIMQSKNDRSFRSVYQFRIQLDVTGAHRLLQHYGTCTYVKHTHTMPCQGTVLLHSFRYQELHYMLRDTHRLISEGGAWKVRSVLNP